MSCFVLPTASLDQQCIALQPVTSMHPILLTWRCRSRQQTELGKIVNLMSADVNHVMQFFYPFFNQLFSAPALLITSLILLYFQIRYAVPAVSLCPVFSLAKLHNTC